MYDTTTDLTGYNNIDVKDGFTQNGIFFNRNNGKKNTTHRTHMPFISFDLNYLNISESKFNTIYNTVYNYFYKTVLFYDRKADLRYKLINDNMNVFMPTDIEFTISAGTLYNGKVSLVSSALFNYNAYQNNTLIQEPTNTILTDKETVDTAFDDLLVSCPPYQRSYRLIQGGKTSNIGANLGTQRVRYIRKIETLSWLLTRDQFYIMQSFYHRYGTYKEFGYNGVAYRFISPTMDYNKSNTNLYPITLEIEVSVDE